MKKFKYMSSIGVMCIVIIIVIASLITPDKEISDLEGRKLQGMPTFNNLVVKEKTHNFNAYVYEGLMGILFKKWDDYFSDNIFLRDKIVNIYTAIQSFENKKYVNGVYLGTDGYFFTDNNPKPLTDEYLKERAEYFNCIAEEFNESKVYMVNLPYKSNVYENNMPIEGYQSLNTEYINKLWGYIDSNKIEIMDINNIFNDNEQFFHKTDHHWNMNGTFTAYNYIISKISKDFTEVGEAKTKDYYNIETYQEYFIGTDGRKAGQLVTEMDDIEVYRHKNEEDYKVTINDKEGKFFYDEQLDKERFNNDYMVYLNGDNAEVIIENTKSNNDLSIVVIGDSMDNPLIPLLSTHFKNIYSYDLRYYKDNLANKIKSIDPDIIVINGLTNSFINKDSELFNIYN